MFPPPIPPPPIPPPPPQPPSPSAPNWKYCERGNRIQSFCFGKFEGTPTKIIIINLDSNVLCWNSCYEDSLRCDESDDSLIFSTPSTPRFIAAELLSSENTFLILLHSAHQTQQTKDAIVKVIEKVVCSGGDSSRIAGISGGNLVEATSFVLVNLGDIFSSSSFSSFSSSFLVTETTRVVVCPPWKEESCEYKKVENGTNAVFFISRYEAASSSIQSEEEEVQQHFYNLLVDHLEYRHANGKHIKKILSREHINHVDLFENAKEITSSQEAAFDTIVGNVQSIGAIVMCGQPGGELEKATEKLIRKLSTPTTTPANFEIYDQKTCVGLKAGILKYKTRLENDIKNGKKIIFCSPNVRRSERIFLTHLVHSVEPSLTVLTALVTKPSWWFNARKNSHPFTSVSLKSYSYLFDFPNSENEKNIVRII